MLYLSFATHAYVCLRMLYLCFSTHAYVCLCMLYLCFATHAYVCLRMLYYEAGGALRALALLERVQEADVLPHVDMLRLVVLLQHGCPVVLLQHGCPVVLVQSSSTAVLVQVVLSTACSSSAAVLVQQY